MASIFYGICIKDKKKLRETNGKLRSECGRRCVPVARGACNRMHHTDFCLGSVDRSPTRFPNQMEHGYRNRIDSERGKVSEREKETHLGRSQAGKEVSRKTSKRIPTERSEVRQKSSKSMRGQSCVACSQGTISKCCKKKWIITKRQ